MSDTEPTPELLSDAAHDASRAIRAAADAVRILRYPGDWSLTTASHAAQEHLANAVTHARDAIRTLAHTEADCPWCAETTETPGPLLCDGAGGRCLLGRGHAGSCAVQDASAWDAAADQGVCGTCGRRIHLHADCEPADRCPACRALCDCYPEETPDE